MIDTKQRENYEDVGIMMEGVDQLRDVCTKMYCLEHDLDSDSASDYARASVAVSEYQAPFTHEEMWLIENSQNSSRYESSEYGLKDIWRKLRKTRDRYLEKIKGAGERAKDWTQEKLEKARDMQESAREAKLMGEFIMDIRSANRQYSRCMAGKDGKIREVCGKESGDRRRECERKIGKRWKGQCDGEALASAKEAVLEIQSKTQNSKIRQNIGFLTAARSFEEFLQIVRSFVRRNYPEYEGYLRYL